MTMSADDPRRPECGCPDGVCHAPSAVLMLYRRCAGHIEADRDQWRTVAQTASDAVKAAHAERDLLRAAVSAAEKRELEALAELDEWKARALAAEGREAGFKIELDATAQAYCAVLRARLDEAERLLRGIDNGDMLRGYAAADEARAFLASAAGELAKEAT